MSIQSTIQSKVTSYPPSMRRLAEAIVADPGVVVEKTISELARQCDTSETSVVRFCRTLGFSGYSQLRIALATELGREHAQRGDETAHGTDIAGDDDLATAVSKIGFSETLCIQETADNLNIAELEKVVSAVEQAGRTALYGVSSSGWSAADLQRKLARIGRIAFEFDDAHDAMTAAALLAKGDVAIAFSHSGRTHEAIEFLRLAGQQTATTVAITNDGDSPLARAADLTLTTVVRETTFRSGAMASRIAQLVLVDCIFVGVAQRSYDSTVEALRRTYQAVAPLRGDR